MKPHERPEISHCLLKEEMCNESLCGPVDIVLALDDSVIIYATYLDATPEGVVGVTNYDCHGNRLVSVPLRYVDEFLTSDEADAVQEVLNKEWLTGRAA